LPELKRVHLRQIFDDYSPAVRGDNAPTPGEDRALIHFCEMAGRFVPRQAQMMCVRFPAHYRSFRGNDANRLFGCLILTNLLIEIGKGLDKEERRYDRWVEVIEKDGFVGAEAL